MCSFNIERNSNNFDTFTYFTLRRHNERSRFFRPTAHGPRLIAVHLILPSTMAVFEIVSGNSHNSPSTSPSTTRGLPHYPNTNHRPLTLVNNCPLSLSFPRRSTAELSRLLSPITTQNQSMPTCQQLLPSTMSLYSLKRCLFGN